MRQRTREEGTLGHRGQGRRAPWATEDKGEGTLGHRGQGRRAPWPQRTREERVHAQLQNPTRGGDKPDLVVPVSASAGCGHAGVGEDQGQAGVSEDQGHAGVSDGQGQAGRASAWTGTEARTEGLTHTRTHTHIQHTPRRESWDGWWTWLGRGRSRRAATRPSARIRPHVACGVSTRGRRLDSV